MALVFQCDRCHEVRSEENEEGAAAVEFFPGDDSKASTTISLCRSCERDFEEWKRPPPREMKAPR